MGKSIVTAAAILAAAFVLTNLYRIVPTGGLQGVYRINSITGEVALCYPQQGSGGMVNATTRCTPFVK